MNEKNFALLCKQNGFQKAAPNLYCRCYGDGLYQMIYSGFKKYYSMQAIDRDPSRANHRSRYITIAVRSLFWKWEPGTFSVVRDAGEYAPCDMMPYELGHEYYFNGIEEEYKIMEAYGFSALNAISTQQDLLDLFCRSQIGKNGYRIHNEALIAPFLITRNFYEAEIEIASAFLRREVYLEDLKTNLTRVGRIDQYDRLHSRTVQRLNAGKKLWRAIIETDYNYLRAFLEINYQKNMEEITQNNIYIHPSFQKAEISFL